MYNLSYRETDKTSQESKRSFQEMVLAMDCAWLLRRNLDDEAWRIFWKKKESEKKNQMSARQFGSLSFRKGPSDRFVILHPSPIHNVITLPNYGQNPRDVEKRF